jgi:hypothetical protein
MDAVVSSQFPDSRSWRELYQAAILELDDTKLSNRIAEAERVIVQRARELFQQSGNNFKEQQALDNAMHALRILRSIARRNRMRNASKNLSSGQPLAWETGSD